MPGNRIHGRNGFLYAAIASGGSAEPVYFLKSWSLDFNTDQVDVTSFGDTNKTYVTGLPDGKGSFDGFWPDDSKDMFTAAQDGVARSFYLYPTRSIATTYWFGSAFFDASFGGDVTGAVTVSGNLAAASAWIRHT